MHHPGPWKKGAGDEAVVRTLDGALIAEVSSPANAALIAKAPELYDVVRELAVLVRGLERLELLEWEDNSGIHLDRLERLVRQAEGGV
jgi:hypothetical protein